MEPYDPDQPAAADAGLFGLPHSPEEAGLVVIPVPWEVTTSYRPGTAGGPEAVRAASHQLDLFDLEVGEAWREGIAMLPIPEDVRVLNEQSRRQAEEIIERGGRITGDDALEAALEAVNAACEELNRYVYKEADRWRKAGKLVAVLGGDHASPFGLIERLAQEGELGILHVDAHADLRQAYEGFTWSHASIMRNVHDRLSGVTQLTQVGIRDVSRGEVDFAANSPRIRCFSGPELEHRLAGGAAWRALIQEVIGSLPQRVYVSFDIDGLDPACCPNTGTPVPGGLTFAQACELLRALGESGREITGFDLCEVAPGPGGDEWDGNVGARILYKLCGWALQARAQ